MKGTGLTTRLPDPPSDASFTSRLRSATVAARVGLWLAVAFGICFVTGLISHYAQNPTQPVPFPASPSWGYRVTQGLHVTTGIASIPLLLVKLWTVYPLLLRRPDRSLRALALDGLEKVSILALVSSALFLLATGSANAAQWYPWAFSFRSSHYALAWVAIGSLIVHIAVKLPVTRAVLGADVDSTEHDRPTATAPGALTRRGLLRTTWVAAGVAALTVAGGTVPFLRRVSIFAVRDGEGPQGVPINKTAAAAGITDEMVGPDYQLDVLVDGGNGATASFFFTRDQLLAMPQTTERLPIACVEGWSASAQWTGVRLRDLLDQTGAARGRDLDVISLQPTGAFRHTVLQSSFADDSRTLLALSLNGEPLSRDHGEPVRLIAPNRPGVLQTKWLARLEVRA
jgi:hypothetical protein